ncbi:MAG TPA: M55 family metallopeptidase [Acidimicrobiales bacterium]|jgi:D-amino peptidase|nr:M55 family metallopeptidase [Acidimicrobiales bacterium]
MRIFISSDMEGTAGVVDWDQVRPTGARYEYFCELLTGEVNAAIEGAARAGATEFLVNDSHGAMANLRPDALAGSARYLSGRHKPSYMMEGLDGSFDAVFFVSYHGSMGSASALSHTYFTEAFAQVTINGVVAGESGINALCALGHGVPVLLVTGDTTTAEEAGAFCPGALTAIVKESTSRFAANSLHPTAARELIAEQACLAVASRSSARPVAISLPATLSIEFKTTDYAELAARIAGCEQTGPRTAVISGGDALAVYRTFITVVLLCRGLRE